MTSLSQCHQNYWKPLHLCAIDEIKQNNDENIHFTFKNLQHSTFCLSLLLNMILSVSLSLSHNQKLQIELAQVLADFDRLKSVDSSKSERLEELS